MDTGRLVVLGTPEEFLGSQESEALAFKQCLRGIAIPESFPNFSEGDSNNGKWI